MTIQERLSLLTELGHFLRTGGDDSLDEAIRQSYAANPWFTPDNIREALHSIAAKLLDPEKLNAWAARYPLSPAAHPVKTIGIVMAGNIPLVGFADWLCVFTAGYRALVKLSEKDRFLLPCIVRKMAEWAFESREYTEFLTDADHLNGMDGIIATGSNNSARYFGEYFGKYPHIIRRNRNSVAVLDGTESVADLYALGHDIFSYFGLGCRNVSKLYVPAGYDFVPLLETLHEYREMILHNKYKNNFNYNFTLLTMNAVPFHNNGCVLLVEDPSFQSRIASVHYEFYNTMKALEADLKVHLSEIQCIAGHAGFKDLAVVPFGHTQQPGLSDYPDGIDVMAFLTSAVFTG